MRVLVAAISVAALSNHLNAQVEVASGSVGGNSYEVFADRDISWTAAEANAVGLGGYLATVTSAGQDSYLAGLDPSGEYWLGGYQSSTEMVATNGWNWVHGKGTFPGVNGASGFTQSFSDWAPGEPNDYYGPGSEQYLAIGLEGAALWNDEGALGNISGYVVEFSSVPDNNGLFIPMGLTFAALALAQRRFAKAA